MILFPLALQERTRLVQYRSRKAQQSFMSRSFRHGLYLMKYKNATYVGYMSSVVLVV